MAGSDDDLNYLVFVPQDSSSVFVTACLPVLVRADDLTVEVGSEPDIGVETDDPNFTVYT